MDVMVVSGFQLEYKSNVLLMVDYPEYLLEWFWFFQLAFTAESM
jgi:hypothetical protein